MTLVALAVYAAAAAGAAVGLVVGVWLGRGRVEAVDDGWPLLRLEWISDVPVAVIEQGDPAQVAAWLDAMRTTQVIRA